MVACLAIHNAPVEEARPTFLCRPFLAANWHSETWTMSPEIAKHLTSWVRYKLGQMVGIHFKTDAELGINTWWKNIHRAGKVALCVCAIATL